MFIHELDELECHRVLEQATIGRLACARENQPYIVPVYFSFDGRHIFGFTTLGQKTEWMRTNPKVCLEVDEQKSHDRWVSVVVLGHYEELPANPEFEAARRAAYEALRKRPMWWEPAYIATQDCELKHSLTPIFYRIHIEQITGRRATPDREDETLEPLEMTKDKDKWLDKIINFIHPTDKVSPKQ